MTFVMESGRVIQGRCITDADIALIRGLLADHPGWNRCRLSCELCERNLPLLTNNTRFLILWVYPLQRDFRRRLCA